MLPVLSGYLVPEEALVSPPVELLQLFVRARSWAKMAPWMRELLRIALRTWMDLEKSMGKNGAFHGENQ